MGPSLWEHGTVEEHWLRQLLIPVSLLDSRVRLLGVHQYRSGQEEWSLGRSKHAITGYLYHSLSVFRLDRTASKRECLDHVSESMLCHSESCAHDERAIGRGTIDPFYSRLRSLLLPSSCDGLDIAE